MMDRQSLYSIPEVKAQIEEACRQIDRGEYLELDEDGMDRYFDELVHIATSSDGNI